MYYQYNLAHYNCNMGHDATSVLQTQIPSTQILLSLAVAIATTTAVVAAVAVAFAAAIVAAIALASAVTIAAASTVISTTLVWHRLTLGLRRRQPVKARRFRARGMVERSGDKKRSQLVRVGGCGS